MIIQVRTTLEGFSKLVKEKKYKRIDYELWRKLLKVSYAEISLEARPSASGLFSCYVIWEGADAVSSYFEIDDKSLGEFLYDKILKVSTTAVDSHSSTIGASGNDYISTIEASGTDYSNYAYINDGVNVAYGNPYINIETNKDNFYINGQTITEVIQEVIENNTNNSNERKENDTMDLFKNFEFGSCENDNVKMSMYGIAVKNATGTWVSYDAKSEQVVDVDILNFNGKYLYKMPVAIKDVAKGDCIIHNRKPMFVNDIDANKLLVIDPAAGEEKIVLLTRNMFGFDFVTKIVNIFGNFTASATADQPFGNMLPLMMLADGGKTDDVLPLMFLMNGGNGFDMSNPMMLYFLMKDGKSNDMLPLMLMANGQSFAYGKHECACGDCKAASANS